MPLSALRRMLHAGAAAALLLACGCSASTDRPPAEETTVKRTAPAAVKASKPASEISFRQEEPWYTNSASFRSSLDFDQPMTQTESTMGYRPRAAYVGPKVWSKLVIDLVCSWDTRAPDESATVGDAPMASLAEVQVFSEDRTKPIAVFSGADLLRERGTENGFEMDGRGPVISTVERVRLPFARNQARIRDGHPYRLTVVALDAQGRTMACDDLDGDEADAPIEPRANPQTGWATPLDGARPSSAAPEQPSTGDGKRPVGASELMTYLPQDIAGWTLVAAYPRLASDHDLLATTSASAHYRQGDHVAVLTIADVGSLGELGRVEFDAPPAPLTDASGTTTFRKDGANWLRENAFSEPYQQQVVSGFSYNMRMDERARPLTPGLAFLISLNLPNGILVTVNGPKDTDLPLLRQIFAAVDGKRLSAIPPIP